MHYILDACALIAFLNDEEGADSVENLLMRAAVNDVSVSMSIVNLLEVYYGELRDKGTEIAQIVIDTIQHHSVHIVNSISEQVFREAARLKATYSISLADAIGIATAVESGGVFVTSDHHELEKVEHKESFNFFWFR